MGHPLIVPRRGISSIEWRDVGVGVGIRPPWYSIIIPHFICARGPIGVCGLTVEPPGRWALLVRFIWVVDRWGYFAPIDVQGIDAPKLVCHGGIPALTLIEVRAERRHVEGILGVRTNVGYPLCNSHGRARSLFLMCPNPLLFRP